MNKPDTNKIIALAVSAIAGLALATPVFADRYNDGYTTTYTPGGVDTHYDYARVTELQPLTETVEVNQPREECRVERVATQVPVGTYRQGRRHASNHGYRQGRSYTPEIVGAVIGGAVGRQVGNGRGQDVATVLGAVLGGSIGRDINRKNRYERNRGHDRHATRYETRYEDVRTCETVDRYHTEERVIGYKVQYEYDGKRYWTQTDYDPGQKNRVRVSVEPIADSNHRRSDYNYNGS